MSTPQSGIFALGTASHAYLELDAKGEDVARELVSRIARLREPRTTMGGVNLVAGFRPELWREIASNDSPPEVEGFNRDLVGPDGYTMPATQHDAVLWLSGSAYDVVFDVARGAIQELGTIASVAEETSSWPYRHDRDLTGFIDGTENPHPDRRAGRRRPSPRGARGPAARSCCCSAGSTTPRRGNRCRSSHRSRRWAGPRPTARSSRIARGLARRAHRSGPVREDLPAQHALRDRHVARDDFVGFSAEQRPLAAMLESMAGLADGVRDAITRFTKPTTSGAYYFVPSIQSLQRAPAQ